MNDRVEAADEARRNFLKTGLGAGAVVAGAAVMSGSANAAPLQAASIGRSGLKQPPLPWKDSALEPVISAKTIELHYGKHHAGYFNTLAGLVKDTPLADASLEEIILATADDDARKSLFNNAGQAWNHNFYWNSLTPEKTAPGGRLLEAINRDFGSVDALKAELAKTTIAQFGSGWGWLVSDGGKLKVMSTSNADVPFTKGMKPLLTVDVWEHAYYVDWQNRRPDHVQAVVKDHLDWGFAGRNFSA
ncbi:superoxide dismutase [Polymorphobacter multimanifer]|uniref:Superoxide dismutase n=1 Tax=Polymorphobacter multimanifer TaxID=1070431 RepID=A0A841LG89_9SPHN|nr:superoxide dismutase [Polymorphobacter multimanifer]MBB6227988.1 Fe-Mn family superoxide dismutase [Polymorphobacter multimanifer]GGI84160.1 superoxide dismutase [Polymorphobacter multimanifer]